MTDNEERPMNKAERLAVAGAVAPSLRSQGAKALRRVALVDEAGNITGYTTLAKVQEALLLERQIELAVQDDVRPKQVLCERCGRSVKVARVGSIPTTCPRNCAAQKVCAGFGETAGRCEEKPGPSALTNVQYRQRKGEPWRCRSCAANKASASEAARKKMHDAARKRASDPAWLKKNADAVRRTTSDPEWLRRQAERNRKRATTPALQARRELVQKARREGLTYQQLAARFGLSIATVYADVHALAAKADDSKPDEE